MTSARAFWYDGKISLRREVVMTCDGKGSLRVEGAGVDLQVPLRQVRIDPRLGTARRLIRFPGGAAAETADHDFLDELQRQQGRGSFYRILHRWEKSVQLALGALLVTLLLGFVFVRYAVPPLATKAAFALPAATEEVIGRETLQVLDRLVLKPTKLSEQRRSELSSLFFSIIAKYPERRDWRLEFRSGDSIGANAFALPSGIVVLTDRLVSLARNENEIAAVLAHEIGHLNRRHALRHLLQNSASALLVATLTGDLTSFSATLPTVLIDAKYSRDFETEADDAAVAYLKGEGIPVQVYADILTKLGDEHRQREKGEESHFGEILADHPMIQERVRRVLGNSKR